MPATENELGERPLFILYWLARIRVRATANAIPILCLLSIIDMCDANYMLQHRGCSCWCRSRSILFHVLGFITHSDLSRSAKKDELGSVKLGQIVRYIGTWCKESYMKHWVG